MQQAKTKPGKSSRLGTSQSLDAIGLEPFELGASRPIDAQLYDRLQRALASGAIAPGQKLTTRSLASAFGFSATPTRIALKQLVAEGVLVGRPRSGFQVAPASAEAYRELLAIRCQLEGLAIRQSATRLSPDDLRRLERLHLKIVAKTHTEATYLELNFAFHFTIYRAAQMPRLLDLIGALWARVGPYLHLVAGFEVQEQFIASHQAMLTALGRRDGEAAEAALRLDLESAAEIMLPHLL